MFLQFRNYLLLEKGVVLHLNTLECPSPKDALCKVWLKFTLWFLRRFLDFGDEFLLFCNYLSLLKGVVIQSQENWISFPQWCFMPSFVVIGSVVLENNSFEFRQCIFAISSYLPLEKGVEFHLFHARKFIWNWPSGSWKEDENTKKLQTNEQTNNRRSEEFIWAYLVIYNSKWKFTR